jgi:uncharacterized protein (DUF2235 family)
LKPPHRRRRLIVCCDGTWNRSDAKNITNVEKIARTIQTDPEACGGVMQLVEYVSGVGVGYTVDRILGGWLGAGVFSNVRAAYRFLALNYEPGDEIYLFGFSRGAYTARSVAGMIGAVGLMTRKSMVQGHFAEALERYRSHDRGANPEDAEYDSLKAFRDACCHLDAPITFLGVFDTVGALGVPTVIRTDHQFHDVKLGPAVRLARHAVAIDERRRPFAPCLWSVPDDAPSEIMVTSATGKTVAVPRVKQVWFQGVHSDVGGGYDASGLSDTVLLWMTDEAATAGLVFDRDLLNTYVESGRPATVHSSMKPMYVIANALERIRPRPDTMRDSFVHGRRNLTPTPVPQPPAEPGKEPEPTSVPVRLASTARDAFDESSAYRPPNLTRFIEQRAPLRPDVGEEPVARLPRRRPASEFAETATPARPERSQA